MTDDDLIRRGDVLAAILKWRLQSGPISTAIYEVVRDMPPPPKKQEDGK